MALLEFIWFLWLARAALHLSANETLISGAAESVGAANCLIRKLPSNQQRSHARPATAATSCDVKSREKLAAAAVRQYIALSVPSAISSSPNVMSAEWRQSIGTEKKNDDCTPQICIKIEYNKRKHFVIWPSNYQNFLLQLKSSILENFLMKHGWMNTTVSDCYILLALRITPSSQ